MGKGQAEPEREVCSIEPAEGQEKIKEGRKGKGKIGGKERIKEGRK